MILALICDSDCQMKDELQVGGSRSLKSPLAFYTESGICSRTFGASIETGLHRSVWSCNIVTLAQNITCSIPLFITDISWCFGAAMEVPKVGPWPNLRDRSCQVIHGTKTRIYTFIWNAEPSIRWYPSNPFRRLLQCSIGSIFHLSLHS